MSTPPDLFPAIPAVDTTLKLRFRLRSDVAAQPGNPPNPPASPPPPSTTPAA